MHIHSCIDFSSLCRYFVHPYALRCQLHFISRSQKNPEIWGIFSEDETNIFFLLFVSFSDFFPSLSLSQFRHTIERV